MRCSSSVGVIILTTFGIIGCSSSEPGEEDAFRWLEEIEGEAALTWVRGENKRTTDELEADPRYATYRDEVLEIISSDRRIPYGTLSGNYVYNFWQDRTHIRGVWRRTTLESYRTNSPVWEVLLDIDALASAEKENWVFKGVGCFDRGQRDRCMVALSRGGRDALVQREYSLVQRKFVTDGFVLPEARSAFSWIDVDTALVGTDWGPGTTTESGYPRIVKLWKRGTPRSAATTVFEGNVTDVGVWPQVVQRPEGAFAFVRRWESFYTTEMFHRLGDGTLRKLPLPLKTTPLAKEDVVLSGRVFVRVDEDWMLDQRRIRAGSVVALDLNSMSVELVFESNDRAAVEGARATRSALVVQMFDNLQSTVRRYRRTPGGWDFETVLLPDNGSIQIEAASAFSDDFMVTYSSPTTPDSLYFVYGGTTPDKFKALPAVFDATDVVVEQRSATSRDGTRVPYFVVGRRSVLTAGSGPVLLYGYGGFQVSTKRNYSATTGKLWLERGGIFVIANIRGGGEFGPQWHQAALKRNRQRAFDDFHAVAEALIETGVTTSRRLGIQGASNGGLLVGVAFTQRPDLYRAVVCEAPLLDMLRYDQLPPGASWVAEYGDPDDPGDRAALAKYSPYQNLKQGVSYPRVFFLTSTKDDRVHPGHARKMAAKMKENGQSFYYFENSEGGHAGTANQPQRARHVALLMTYLWRELVGPQ